MTATSEFPYSAYTSASNGIFNFGVEPWFGWIDCAGGRCSNAQTVWRFGQGPTLMAVGLLTGGAGEGVVATEAETTSVFWSGSGTQAAANAFAATNNGIMVRLGSDASLAEAQAASLELAANASGNVVVFQSVEGTAVNSVWAQTEYPALMANPNVTGITYNVIDSSGTTVWSSFVPK